jgi:hypothetical protein
MEMRLGIFSSKAKHFFLSTDRQVVDRKINQTSRCFRLTIALIHAEAWSFYVDTTNFSRLNERLEDIVLVGAELSTHEQ